ncbi:ABC transporter substrate-binding protein [Spelaeicoccus albus]|uniref:ABC-type branched-subunit amino acid transport system substrate-binding protein n=1 Tax=Spelaeicoccus albus TaxID=1280376 RepID=A0A7Z0IJ48_9MICO|nr:ABC transporter substrate-binding protein [Spelaeicoccus albus]NYI69066.1 ABC-type branched-subunit amino acid transport system substrate-binding protein [Spelaeicoccus albus]
MSANPSLLFPSEIILAGRQSGRLVIGLLVPLSGIMGAIGPSTVNCAQLAAEEASSRGNGRLVDLLLIDAGRTRAEVEREISALVSSGLVDGIVGCHTSDIRASVVRAVNARVPYVFTPPREFERIGSRSSYLLGPAPDCQLAASLRWFHEYQHIRRWALIGSDYVWPRHVHRAARAILGDFGLEVTYERTVRFGDVDAESIIHQMQNTRSQGLIVSLVGRDAVEFHRQFAAHGRASSIPRLCTSFDEDSLLAVGGDSTGALFAAMPSFLTDGDERHQKLLAAYENRFGAFAPSLGAYSESVYDGVHLMSSLRMARNGDQPSLIPLANGMVRRRDDMWQSSPLGAPGRAMTLGQANGTAMNVVQRFALA